MMSRRCDVATFQRRDVSTSRRYREGSKCTKIQQRSKIKGHSPHETVALWNLMTDPPHRHSTTGPESRHLTGDCNYGQEQQTNIRKSDNEI